MVNVAHPPRQSLGPSQAVGGLVPSDPVEDDYDELASSDEDDTLPNDNRSLNHQLDQSSILLPPPARPDRSQASPASQPSPQPEDAHQQQLLPDEPSPQPEAGPSTAVERSPTRSPPPPPELPLVGLRVVPTGKFSPAMLAEIEQLVLALGGEWPKPFKLNKDASLAVLGRDIQPKAQDKILRLGLPTALGLDGLKAWVKERQHSIQPVHEEPLFFEQAEDDQPAEQEQEQEQEQEAAEAEAVPADDPPVADEEPRAPSGKGRLFEDRDHQPLSFWIEGKVHPTVRTDLEGLIKEHGGVMETVEEADFRLLDPTTPFGKANLAADAQDEGVDQLPWRGRPWHWVHVSVGQNKMAARKSLESRHPVFVRPKLDGNGAQLVCYVAKALDRDKPYLAQRIRSYGGAITTEKAKAKVFVVDEDTPDLRSTETIKRRYASDTKKFIVPYQWVEKSIKRGVCAPLVRTGAKNDFYTAEDELLPRYLAEVIVGQERGTDQAASTQKMKRNGNKIYEYLCDDAHADRWPWSSRHPWQSWRERYLKFKPILDPLIEDLCRQLRRNGRFTDPDPRLPGNNDGDELDPQPRNGNKRARSSSSSVFPSGSPRPQSLSPAPASAGPSPKRARVEVASRDRSPSLIPGDEQAEQAFAYPADDDHMDFGNDQVVVPPADEKAPMDDDIGPASVAVAVDASVNGPEEEEFEEDDRRALEHSLRIPVKEVARPKSAIAPLAPVENRQALNEPEGESDDDDPTRWLAPAPAVPHADQETVAQPAVGDEDPAVDGDHDLSDDDDDPSRYLAPRAASFPEDEDAEMGDVSGGLEVDEDDRAASVELAAAAAQTRASRSRSAVSAEPASPSSSRLVKNLPRGDGAVAVDPPTLRVQDLPHLDLETVPRRSSTASSRRASSPPKGSPEPVSLAPRSLVGALASSVVSAASHAFDAIASPRKMLQPPSGGSSSSSVGVGKPSPAPSSSISPKPGFIAQPPSPAAAIAPSIEAAPPSPPLVNIHPPPPAPPSRAPVTAAAPAASQPTARPSARSPVRAPVPLKSMTASERKRHEQEAVAWARDLERRLGFPFMGNVQALRAANRDFAVAEATLIRGAQHVWTKEEDAVVLGGTGEETRRLQAEVGPMEFVKRLSFLRQ